MIWTIDVEIELGVGAGLIKLRMLVDETRRILGQPTYSDGYEGKMMDRYRDIGFDVHWTEESRVCFAIEFFPPASPFLFDIPVLGSPYDMVKGWLKRDHAPDLELGFGGATSEMLGIHLNCVLPTELPRNPVTSIYVYARKYF